MKAITILALSWRDIHSPKSGGAEVYTHSLLNGMDENRFHIIHFAPHYEGLEEQEEIGHIQYIRKGGIFSVIFHAWRFYRTHRDEIDFVIDQCNTHRFFSSLWVPKKKRIFLIHQLTREIWDINLPFPWNRLGFHLENWMLRLNRKDITITVSQSTKEDLLGLGFLEEHVHIIPNGVDERILSLNLDNQPKGRDFVFAGRYSKYKGIDVCVEALGILKKIYPDAKLHVLGKRDDKFVEEVISPIAEKYRLSYGYRDTDTDVILHGFVSEEEKFEVMKNARCLLFPSQREGWGIIVTEAAAMGTPSIVYDSPGCRDAVDLGKAGYLCKKRNAEGISELMLRSISNEQEYLQVREFAYQFAQQFSWKKNRNMFEDMLRQEGAIV